MTQPQRWRAEKWTTVGQIRNGRYEQHEVWCVVDSQDGLPVAFGGDEFTKRYADTLNRDGGVVFDGRGERS
jgi:hypothetical protein